MINHGKIVKIETIAQHTVITFEDGIKWADINVRELEYIWCNYGITFVISPLSDPTQSESSNNGNYREYMSFWIERSSNPEKVAYMTSNYWSYHGDLESYPDDQNLPFDEWYDLLRQSAYDNIISVLEEEQALDDMED